MACSSKIVRYRVAIALRTGYQDQLDRFNGVMRWMVRKGNWDIQLIREKLDYDRLKQLLSWRIQGMIVSNQLSLAAVRVLAQTDLPLVTMDMREPGHLLNRATRMAEVTTDSDAVGRAAATYFLEQYDYPRYAFIGAHPCWDWSQDRGLAFQEVLTLHGKHCEVYTMQPNQSFARERHRLTVWLKRLAKPTAVFVACDRCAGEVLELCSQIKIRVPEELGVLGVDNETLICTHTQPTLSSIQPDFEEGGFQAAVLLNQIMRGRLTARKTVWMAVKQIVGRGSTAHCSPAGWLVQKAREYIREKACEGICVEDVVRYLRVSRRLADLRFRQIEGHSILDVIQTTRLEQVTLLLRTTTLPIKEIGDLCGYRTENYLRQRFKKTFGVTMREYRKHCG